MKALVKSHAEPGLCMEDVPIPEVGPDDVLVNIDRTGICGTDVHIYEWDDWARSKVPIPLTLGHEFAGEIVEIGANVRQLKVGQRVSGEGHVVGSKSRASRSGRFHLDPETRGIGIHIPGAFAEYLSLPAFNAVPLPDDIDNELGAILDPLGNAVHSALSFDLIGEDVLVTGAGPIGIMAAAVARHVGARHVVITDINPLRLEIAAHTADVTTVNVAEEDLQSVRERLGIREGFDVGLEMSGASSAFAQMVEHMIMGGNISLLGMPEKTVQVDWKRIVFRMLTIKGIYGREMYDTWYKMLAMLQSGLSVREVITHRLSVEEFQKGFNLMQEFKCGKVVLKW